MSDAVRKSATHGPSSDARRPIDRFVELLAAHSVAVIAQHDDKSENDETALRLYREADAASRRLEEFVLDLLGWEKRDAASVASLLPRCLEAESRVSQLEKAIRRAVSLIDEAMGDTDPNDADDPLLRASQTLRAAIDPEAAASLARGSGESA